MKLAQLTAAVPRARFLKEALADLPLALYLMDEPAGYATMLDSSGNGRHGTYEANAVPGGPQLVRSNPSVTMGTTTTVRGAVVADAAWNNFAGGDWTIGCLIRTSNTSRNFIAKDRVGADYPEFVLFTNAVGAFQLNCCTSNAPATGDVTGGVVTDGSPHLVTAIRRGNTLEAWQDAVRISSAAFTGSIWDSTNALTIGSSSAVNTSFSTAPLGGQMSHVFFYGKALTGQRLKALQDALFAGPAR